MQTKKENSIDGLGHLPQANLFDPVPDFTGVVHTRENKKENEDHLNANRFHFVGQCAVVYSLLMKGMVLSVRTASMHWNIGDLRRRIKDLKDEGNIEIDECFEMSKDGRRTRFKMWYIYDRLSEATKLKYKIPHPVKK